MCLCKQVLRLRVSLSSLSLLLKVNVFPIYLNSLTMSLQDIEIFDAL
jgi:hypothetical protein